MINFLISLLRTAGRGRLDFLAAHFEDRHGEDVVLEEMKGKK